MEKQEKYELRLQIEHELINRRLTWLLTSQSILFAALAFVIEKGGMTPLHLAFSKIVPILGICISIAILIGVLMAIIAKTIIWQDYKAKTGDINFGVRTWITFIAFIPDIFMPIFFSAAWCFILTAIL